MKKIAIFADVSNLYHSINRKYPNDKIDYDAYLDYCKGFGKIVCAKAYGSQSNHQAEGFFSRLKKIGFEVQSRDINGDSKISWDVPITMDCLEEAALANMNIAIIGSASGNLAPLVENLKNYNVKPIILACGISKRLTKTGIGVEIPRSMLL